ncbi:hypothetical protein [Streptomyces sp. NPDC059639]|uniref:hypothetical protein n=1 Tax=Streptomyces sp. NPDC059639 TaxID=3346891 RepID=UPI0036792463
MHTRTLGQGLEVSAIGLGAMGMSQSYGRNPGGRDDMIAAATAVALSAEEVAGLDGLAQRVGVSGDRYNAEHMALVNR